MRKRWYALVAIVALATLAAGTLSPASGQNPIVVGASISQTGRLAVTAAYPGPCGSEFI